MMKAWLGAAWLGVAACTGGATGPTTGGAKVEAKADAKAAVKPGDVVVDAKVEAKPDAAAPGEDWLVWWFAGGKWTTRWLRVEGERATLVGEKEALVIGDGSRLWQVERADGRVQSMGCECMEDEKAEGCVNRGHMPTLGLRARPLLGGDAVTIVEASTATEFGDDFTNGLTIVGGVQGTVWAQSSQNGYYCGAHGSYGSSEAVFDVAAGKGADRPFGDWWRRLPESMRRAAAEEIRTAVVECDAGDGPVTVEQIMNEQMGLHRVGLRLDKGAPALSLEFSVDLPYVCSPDYLATGSATSGLIPEAAPLGIAGPLPAAVMAELAKIGESHALGFSKLTLAEADRQARVAAFAGVTAAPWPKEEVSDDDGALDPARAQLDAGRSLTRSGDLAKAIAAFDAAIKIDDKLGSAWSGRCYAKLRAADHVGARADCQAALGLDPKPVFQAAVWFNLGLIAEATDKRDEALAAYKKSLALRDTKQAKAAITALEARK